MAKTKGEYSLGVELSGRCMAQSGSGVDLLIENSVEAVGCIVRACQTSLETKALLKQFCD